MSETKPKRELTPNQRIRLLTKPNWDYHDIMLYFGWSRCKAIQVKMYACEHGGAIRFHSDQVLSSVVLELQGIDKQKEIDLCLKVIDKDKEEN